MPWGKFLRPVETSSACASASGSRRCLTYSATVMFFSARMLSLTDMSPGRAACWLSSIHAPHALRKSRGVRPDRKSVSEMPRSWQRPLPETSNSSPRPWRKSRFASGVVSFTRTLLLLLPLK